MSQEIESQKLLDEAVTLLAGWCLAVEQDASWDDWDSYYKDANYGIGPLRELISKKKREMENAKEIRREWESKIYE